MRTVILEIPFLKNRTIVASIYQGEKTLSFKSFKPTGNVLTIILSNAKRYTAYHTLSPDDIGTTEIKLDEFEFFWIERQSSFNSKQEFLIEIKK